MYWRLPRADFDREARARNTRLLFEERVRQGPPPGLLAYDVEGLAVGWVQVGPRADVPNWNGPRRLSAPAAQADAGDPRVWAISCFVVRRAFRDRKVSHALVEGAIAWARKNGARCLEACPVDTGAGKRPAASLYHGVRSTFARAGFEEVARRRADRPLLRLTLAARKRTPPTRRERSR